MTIWNWIGQAAQSGAGAFSTLFGWAGSLIAGDPATRRQVAFSVALIALSAKMAKADGIVTADEVAAFRRGFAVPPGEERNVERLFDLARQDVAGFETYARRVAALYDDDCCPLEDVLDGLFVIAKADGAVHAAEMAYLEQVATIFGFSQSDFERIAARHVVPEEGDPYLILGVGRDWPFDRIRRALSPAGGREPSRQGDRARPAGGVRRRSPTTAWPPSTAPGSASSWSAAGWRRSRRRGEGRAMTAEPTYEQLALAQSRPARGRQAGRYPAPALHRHGLGGGGARPGSPIPSRGLGALSLSARTAASSRWSMRRNVPGMPARRSGPARATSIRARSASRSPIPAMNSAIAASRRCRSRRSSRSAATFSPATPSRRERVLAHSDVAPARKEDPGELFPWGELAAAGIGHWVMPELVVAGPSLRLGDSGAAVADPQAEIPRLRLWPWRGIRFRRGDGGGGARLPAPFSPGAGRRHRRRLDHRHPRQACCRARVKRRGRNGRWPDGRARRYRPNRRR